MFFSEDHYPNDLPTILYSEYQLLVFPGSSDQHHLLLGKWRSTERVEDTLEEEDDGEDGEEGGKNEKHIHEKQESHQKFWNLKLSNKCTFALPGWANIVMCLASVHYLIFLMAPLRDEMTLMVDGDHSNITQLTVTWVQIMIMTMLWQCLLYLIPGVMLSILLSELCNCNQLCHIHHPVIN